MFGHSHLDVDLCVDGVRYCQNSLGHPTNKVASARIDARDDPTRKPAPRSKAVPRVQPKLMWRAGGIRVPW